MNELRFIDSFTKFDASVSLESKIENNSWMLSMPVECYSIFPVSIGDYVYIEGTEWGGPVEKIRHNSSNSTLEIYGMCWRGLLMRSVIRPNDNEAHLNITASDGNEAISALLGGRMSNIFEVSSDECPIEYSHSFRYATLLDAIVDSLSEHGCRLGIVFRGGRAVISAEHIMDYSGEVEFSPDWDGGMVSEIGCLGNCNHILALGAGELLERQVVDLWKLPNGEITDNASAEGIPSENELRTYLYDYSAVESLDELKSYAKRKLNEFSQNSALEFTLEDGLTEMNLGDVAGARDYITGLAQKLKVSEKILTIDSSGINLKHSMKAI